MAAEKNEIGPVVAVKGTKITPALVIEGEGYLSDKQFGEFICRRERQRREWRNKNRGPRFVRIGREIFYPVAAVEAWLAAGGRRGPGRPRTRRTR